MSQIIIAGFEDGEGCTTAQHTSCIQWLISHTFPYGYKAGSKHCQTLTASDAASTMSAGCGLAQANTGCWAA